ncbi:Rpn11/EIF3F C-terminal domain [Ostreococcus tauri]|uniref:Rpn11/EIF3F C-terminal domain n=1 Tax=Ostreococcus tauri TaxID=70448 RepID=A0A090N4R9_OSTTA|nr:Rpn11/EIF3F C-terminal domain [Ostreococcus tauri]CEG01190.1 Rpn11/EIF3F C-terminal domain [Ostreococcus tauri]|eukprot:XP_022840833.1 Rpn11/EIF3F C-terminal domain [Ostreococcus tauri]
MPALVPPGSIAKVIVDPSVVLGACDSYVRRDERADAVIGAVLGTSSALGCGRVVINARTSYAIPCHERDGEMFVDVEFHRTMLSLHARVTPEERVVGWFSAGTQTPAARALAHEFFAKETAGGTPVHVMLDADFTGVESGGEVVRASVGETVLAVTDRESGESKCAGARFSDVECEVNLAQATKLGVRALRSASSAKSDDDVAGLAQTMGKLGALLAEAQEYVDAVARGERQGDAEVGRALSAALESVPQLTKSQFDKVFGDAVEDASLVKYLTNLTRAQLELASKLHTSALIL